MYICIDVGGTKTLIACLDDNGVIVEKTKIATAAEYHSFIAEVSKVINSFEYKEFEAGAVAVPAISFDRNQGVAYVFGNLPWKDVPIVEDLQKIAKCKFFIENDAKLGGLSEAMLLKDNYKRILYVTVSTGIGFAVVDNLKIDSDAGDAGGRIMLVKNGDKYVPWETLASGRALVQNYGMEAKDITDPQMWQEFTDYLSEGLIVLIAIFQPQAIIIGGSVGHYFDRFAEFLNKSLERYELPLIGMPKIMGAQRADDAVIYGCYDFTKQKLSYE